MATSGLLKRLATNGREELRPGTVAVQPRSSAHGKGTRIGLLWVLGDVVIVLAALMIAVRGWLGEGLFGADSPYRTNIMFHNHPTVLLSCLGWFILSLILVSKRYHLYGPMQMRNTLHEQRLTIQACLTAGLLLSGALYLVRLEVISRGVVIITVVATTVLLCGRRLIWRMMMYRRFESGLEVRNIIIVGTGRVGQAMRHHLDSIRHLGYSFKGYVHMPGVDAENPALSGDILGSIDQLLPLARQFFADEIFLSSPCDARVVTRIVTQAREAGVDIRVVPELYDRIYRTVSDHSFASRGDSGHRFVPQAHSRCAAFGRCAPHPVAAHRGYSGCRKARFAGAHLLLLRSDREEGARLPLYQIPHHGGRCGASPG
jgi:hypothetical protein